MKPRKKKIGIVLGGGGSRCFAHLGMLQELAEHGIKPDYILGCSMGSLIAVLAANDVPISRIKDEFFKLSTRLKWFIPNGFFTFSQKAVRDILSALLPVKRMEHSHIPVGCVATDLTRGTSVVFERGDIVQAVCASSAHPAVHRLVHMDDTYLADGGILDNVPADLCRSKIGTGNFVLSSSLEGPIDQHFRHINRLNIFFRSVYIPLLCSRSRVAHENSDVILEPLKEVNLNFRNWRQLLIFDSIALMEHFFDLGRKEAQRKMPQILRLLDMPKPA